VASARLPRPRAVTPCWAPRRRENSRLPAAAQRRYEQLRRKCERSTLTERELTEYQALLQQLEARNVKRVEALIALAQRRGTDVRTLMRALGLVERPDVC
jgi:hypothetical protein